MSSTSPNILLTGAAGQLGRELLASLSPLGNVIATTHAPSDVPALASARVLDLSDEQQVRATVRETQPKLIVNAAAYTAVDRAETEREACWRVNALAPGWLAEEASRCGAGIVHYSTDYVFNGSGTRPWREDDASGPLNYYGESKLAGEQAIRVSGASQLILRTSWVFGAHGHNFVATMLKLGQARQQLRVVSDQIGAPTSAGVLADVTARIIAQASGSFADWLSARGGTFHVACRGETSWHAFAAEIFRLARAAGMPIVVQNLAAITTAEYPTPARRPLNSRLDLSKLNAQFGLVTPDWPEALARTFTAIARKAT